MSGDEHVKEVPDGWRSTSVQIGTNLGEALIGFGKGGVAGETKSLGQTLGETGQEDRLTPTARLFQQQVVVC